MHHKIIDLAPFFACEDNLKTLARKLLLAPPEQAVRTLEKQNLNTQVLLFYAMLSPLKQRLPENINGRKVRKFLAGLPEEDRFRLNNVLDLLQMLGLERIEEILRDIDDPHYDELLWHGLWDKLSDAEQMDLYTSFIATHAHIWHDRMLTLPRELERLQDINFLRALAYFEPKPNDLIAACLFTLTYPALLSLKDRVTIENAGYLLAKLEAPLIGRLELLADTLWALEPERSFKIMHRLRTEHSKSAYILILHILWKKMSMADHIRYLLQDLEENIYVEPEYFMKKPTAPSWPE